jgi:Glycosyl transferase family 2
MHSRLSRLRHLAGSAVRLLDTSGEIARLHRENAELRSENRELRDVRKELRGEFSRVREILQFVYDDPPANRRRLWELRGSPEYEVAFAEPDPLVSVIVPTYMNVNGLVNVAVPSVLAQTYANWELLIVGDCSPPEVGEALDEFDDPRIVYHNRERRGPYPDDPVAMRLVMGGPPFTEAVRRSHGRWIAPFADDDAYVPYALETLVATAQKNRYELCYSQIRRREKDGSVSVRGEWPPERRRLSLLGAVYHAGLTFIEHELADLPFGVSSDKSILRRMLHAGVRFGWVEEPLADYFWKPRTRAELEELAGAPPEDSSAS